MILLGIDPGIADMGYGVIDVSGGKERWLAHGSVKTPAGSAMSGRLARLYDALQDIITEYRPVAVAMERLYFSKNVKTALAVSEARGVMRVCIEKNGLECREFSPQEVKLAVCGHGGAEKVQVQKMVKALLGLKEIPEPDDAADALAMAITLANTKKFA
jgi:crossover junction endodeoxyribonuclease RuvC